MIPEKCMEHPWIKNNLKSGISNRKLDKRRLSNYVVKSRWNKALHSIHAVVRMGLAGLKGKNLVQTKTSYDLFSNIQELRPKNELKLSTNMSGVHTLFDHNESMKKEQTNLDNKDDRILRLNTKQVYQLENTDDIEDGNHDTKRYSNLLPKDFLSSGNTETFKRSMEFNKCRHINELGDTISISQNINTFSTRDKKSIVDNLLEGYASKEQPLCTKNWNLERTIKQRSTLSNTIETPKFLTKEGRPIKSGAVLRIANLFSSNQFS